METRAGARGTYEDDVFFTEADIPGADTLGRADAEISRQNATLTEVKRELAAQVKRAGGNALTRFNYGQKAHAWWSLLLFKWDTESWHGSGLICRIPGSDSAGAPLPSSGAQP